VKGFFSKVFIKSNADELVQQANAVLLSMYATAARGTRRRCDCFSTTTTLRRCRCGFRRGLASRSTAGAHTCKNVGTANEAPVEDTAELKWLLCFKIVSGAFFRVDHIRYTV
jgi:hypothetical protein